MVPLVGHSSSPVAGPSQPTQQSRGARASWPSSAAKRWRRAAFAALGASALSVCAPLVVVAAPDSPRAGLPPAVVAGPVATWGGGLFGAKEALTPPAGLDDAVAVAASDTYGSAYNLALRADGTVVGWGLDPDGAATPPADLADVTAIDTGAGFSVALRSDGSIATWGSNSSGQREVPDDLGPVRAVSAGGFVDGSRPACGFGLALKADGTVAGWGKEPADGSCSGQLAAVLDVPADLHNVVAISAGNRQALALLSDGTVVGWGQNGAGQAQPPSGLSDVVAIAAGMDHSLALRSDGTVVGWGVWGESGPPNVKDATAIASSWGDVILRADGSIFLWTGYTWGDQPTGSDYVAVAAGYGHGAAIVRPADQPDDPPTVAPTEPPTTEPPTTEPPTTEPPTTEPPTTEPTAPPSDETTEPTQPPESDSPDPAGVVLGSADVQPVVDENSPGTAEAFRSVATAGGPARRLNVYVDESSAAAEIVAGVYSDDSGRPGRLLGSGRLTSPVEGAWNTVVLPATDITAGTPYWLAVLGPDGTGVLRFRDVVDGQGGPTQTSAQTWLDGLPRFWRPGRSYANAPASLHLVLG